MEQTAKKMGITTESLHEIIQNSEYTSEGWYLRTNIQSFQLRILYNFYRELILDGKIPLSCISGIKSIHGFEISHIRGVRESLFDIIKNLQMAVFPAGSGIEYGVTDHVNGLVHLNDLTVNINNAKRKSFIKTYAFTCTESISLEVRMTTGTGKARMSANARLCAADTHLPLTTNHGVGNYINVHALNGNVIRHTVDHNKLDFEAFSKYFINFLLSGLENNHEKQQIPVKDIFDAMFDLVDPKYKKSWQLFVNNFYMSYESHQYTLEHLKQVYAGASRMESVYRLASVKGVSDKSAEYFLQLYLEQYFRSSWTQ